MRECLFCGSPKVSREHMWSDWVNKCLPTTMFNVTKSDRDGNVTKWKSEGLAQTVRAVCEQCNNGWMSRLENEEAKPSLSGLIKYGAPVSVLPIGIKAIATYALKMAIIANATGELADHPYFSTPERHCFAKNLEIPMGIQIWLYALNAPGKVTGVFNSHTRRISVPIKYPFETCVSTFGIGFLGFQVVATRWVNPHLTPFLGGFPGLIENPKWMGRTVQLWPNRGKSIVWPPPFPIQDDGLREFINRWDKVTPPAWMV